MAKLSIQEALGMAVQVLRTRRKLSQSEVVEQAAASGRDLNIGTLSLLERGLGTWTARSGDAVEAGLGIGTVEWLDAALCEARAAQK